VVIEYDDGVVVGEGDVEELGLVLVIESYEGWVLDIKGELYQISTWCS
jgi:hypothetical protein